MAMIQNDSDSVELLAILFDSCKDIILAQPASKSHNLPIANAAFIPRPGTETVHITIKKGSIHERYKHGREKILLFHSKYNSYFKITV